MRREEPPFVDMFQKSYKLVQFLYLSPPTALHSDHKCYRQVLFDPLQSAILAGGCHASTPLYSEDPALGFENLVLTDLSLPMITDH